MGIHRLRHATAAILVAIAGGVTLAAAPGLVAAYGFEENAGLVTADASGNGNTAILVGAAWTTQGRYGNALTFDGTTSWLTAIHDAPALRLTTGMTLEAWVRPSSVVAAWTDVVYKGNDNYFLESAAANGRPAAGGMFGGTAASIFGTAPLAANTWTHLATTYDGATLRLYVNGTQVASAARTGALATSGFPLQIGGDSFYRQRFAGTIDEVRIYNRALTAGEIQSDMATPLVVAVADAGPPSAPGAATAVPFSGTSVKLTWGPATDDVGVLRYRLERCRGVGCADFVDVGFPGGSAYTDTGLALSTTYAYRVSAVDAAANVGPATSVVSAKTLAGASIPGLVAAYGFEAGSGASVADASGNGHAGTILGATWTSGRHGQALSFNGTTSKVNVPDAPALRLTTALTLSAWVRPNSLPPTNCNTPSCHWTDVIYKGNDCYYILASSDINQQPEAGGILASGKHILFGVAPLPIGAWTHLALTYDGAMLRVYADGTLVSGSAQTGAFITSTRPLQIGGDDDYGQHFAGTIDEVRLYDRALTPEEIQADLAAPVEGGPSNPTPTTSTLAPSTATSGAPGVALDVSGTGFTAESVVVWNDAARETLFVSPGLLRATIPASDLAVAGSAQVAVFNAPPIGGTSNEQTFTICAGAVWYRDADGDGRGDAGLTQASCDPSPGFVAVAGDCDDADATAWEVPGEAGALLLLPDRVTMAWSAPASPGGTSIHYDALRAGTPHGFELGGTCVETDGADTVSEDASTPGDGEVLFYLVRAGNPCGEGTLGHATSGTARVGVACP